MTPKEKAIGEALWIISNWVIDCGFGADREVLSTQDCAALKRAVLDIVDLGYEARKFEENNAATMEQDEHKEHLIELVDKWGVENEPPEPKITGICNCGRCRHMRGEDG